MEIIAELAIFVKNIDDLLNLPTWVKKLWVETEDREVPERSSNVSFIAVSHVRGIDG